MAEPNITIESKTAAGAKQWGFVISATGQLDYTGRIEQNKEVPSNSIEGSTYFSAAWYTWLPEELRANITVHLELTITIPNADTFAYLTHIGAVLSAIEAKDTLLVAELISRRMSIFMKFAQLTMFIIEPIAAESLFALMFGRLGEPDNYFMQYYSCGGMFSADEDDATILFYEAAKKRLAPVPEKETPAEMFTRFFKTNTHFELTIGIVGANFHDWSQDGLVYVDAITREEAGRDFVQNTSAVRTARDTLFLSLGVTVQAEPYNAHDSNAIAVCIDDIRAKLSGNGGKVHAGYIRATGAAILRKALPSCYSFNASLARIGCMQDGAAGVVVRIGA